MVRLSRTLSYNMVSSPGVDCTECQKAYALRLRVHKGNGLRDVWQGVTAFAGSRVQLGIMDWVGQVFGSAGEAGLGARALPAVDAVRGHHPFHDRIRGADCRAVISLDWVAAKFGVCTAHP